MFATLGGALPQPPVPSLGEAKQAGRGDALADDRVAVVVGDQVAAGLEPVTDGGLRHPDGGRHVLGSLDGIDGGASKNPSARRAPTWREPILVDEWRFVASLVDGSAKQSLPGPYTLGRLLDAGPISRETATLAIAEALNAEIGSLAGAGCPLIEVVEDAATQVGDSPAERRLFVEAQRRLLRGLDGGGVDGDGPQHGSPHLTLAIRGGNADTAGAATILDAPYTSYLFDLCAGPDNWRLIVDVPTDRGVIVGAADAGSSSPDALELLAFAIGYAASTRGRGHDRVGVATSGDMIGLDYPTALAKMGRVGEIAALYAGPPGALAKALDPRAIDARSAGLGRYAPGPPVLGRDRETREGGSPRSNE